MEPISSQKKPSAGTPGATQALWDPFWLMREMFGWGRSVAAPLSDAKKTDGPPSFEVKETDGAYVCKFKLTLPQPVDGARIEAKLDKGEVTVIVPKAVAVTSAPTSLPRKRRIKGNGRGATARTPRRGR